MRHSAADQGHADRVRRKRTYVRSDVGGRRYDGGVMIEPASTLFNPPENPPNEAPDVAPESSPRRRITLDLDGLNPAQREAVTLPVTPVLVIAGAGSGKTRVLTHRLAYLIAERDASPFSILAITFTNKAAAEMKERVAALVGGVARRMWVSTFHSACRADPAPRGDAARLPPPVHDLRPGRCGPVVRLGAPRSRPRSEAVPAAAAALAHLDVQERPDPSRRAHGQGGRPARDPHGPHLHRVSAPAQRGFRGRLRRPVAPRRAALP